MAGAADNSANLANPARIDTATTVCTLYTTQGGAAWTNSGTKGAYYFALIYTF